MIIRNEKPSDTEIINEVVKKSFKDNSFSLETEHFTINDLRDDDALAVSLVCEIDGQIAGHIAFSKITISDGTKNWYALGPLSVLPEFQGQRIGTSLVNNGLEKLESKGSQGCVIVGLPTYFNRFGFFNNELLIHGEVPQEVFVSRVSYGRMPNGTAIYHKAFKQLSLIEKDTITDVIVNYHLSGARLDPENPAVESLIEKDILTRTPDGRYVMRPAALEDYDSYFAKISQFRITEMSRVHKNPIMAAVKYGFD